MEDWQASYIKESLPKLINLTEFNCNVRVVLLAERVLSDADVDFVEAKQWGNIEKSYHYYQKLVCRKVAYEKLTKALFENGQSGAAQLLMEGFIKHGETQPFTACNISFPCEVFPEADVLVRGQLYKIKDFFHDVNIKAVEEIFRGIFSETDYYDMFINKEQTFELIRDTIPPKPHLYVPRYLSNRIKIDPRIFKENCLDIFVFKGIGRHQLSEIAQQCQTEYQPTSTSTSQRDELTSRFILLDCDEDFSDILELSKVPVHLIKYESDQDLFILEFTSKHSEIIGKYLIDRERVYITEEEFTAQQIIITTPNAGVCICDAPGMGKTFLLASIARSMAAKLENGVVAFIMLSRLLENISYPLPSLSQNEDDAIRSILKYFCHNGKHVELLFQLLKQSLTCLYLFFDGFDEIPSTEIDWIKKLLKSLTTNHLKIKIYVTSRSYMRQDLESTLGVIGYDILPFSRKNQTDFLTSFWSTKMPQCKTLDLQIFAHHCLKMLKDTLSEEDQEITGIPLLCQLIADVYTEDACVHSNSVRKDLRLKSRTLCDMYKSFIENKINAVASQVQGDLLPSITEDETRTTSKIKRIILYYAFKLLFPEVIPVNLENSTFAKNDLQDKIKIYKTGILNQNRPGHHGTADFIHRTFAEYLVAEYVAELISASSGNESWSSFIYNIILDTFNENETDEDDDFICYYDNESHYSFKHPVIVYFLNNLIGQLSVLSWEDSENKVEDFCEMITPSRLLVLLQTCCQQNASSVFNMFRQTLMKCDKTQFKKYKVFFTKERCLDLIITAIKTTKSRMVNDCFKLCSLTFHYEVIEFFNTNTNSDSTETLLQVAAQNGNYEAVEYLCTKYPLQDQNLVENCVQDTYGASYDVIRNKIAITQLLLTRNIALAKESLNILVSSPINFELMKILIKSGASTTATALHAVWNRSLNFVMYTSSYMLPHDYDELAHFVLLDMKEDRLFKHQSDWGSPMEFIFSNANLLRKTINLFFDILGSHTCVFPSGETILFSAIRANKLSLAQQLVENGMDYNLVNTSGNSLLHVAAEQESRDIIKYLLDLGLKINGLDQNLNSPLHFCKQLSTLHYLSDAGGMIELQNSHGNTAAHNIIQNFLRVDINAAALFICDRIATGEIFNIKNLQGNTVLHTLLKETSNLQASTLAMILNKPKVDININNNEAVNPTMLAVKWCGQNLSQCLVQFGADLFATDQQGKCVLHYSAENQHTDTTKYLLSFGLNINKPDAKSNTPLHFCRTLKTMALFIETGANLFAQNDEGDTFIHSFQRNENFIEEKLFELFELLISTGKTWEIFKIRNLKGEPDPSIVSAKITNYVQILSPKFPNIPYAVINQKDYNGDTLLLLEAKFNRQANVSLLIKHGAHINATNHDGHNLVHISALNDNIEFLKYTVTELNMDINSRDKLGNTPILLAARKSKLETIVTMVEPETIVAMGADLSLRNCEGQNILHIAASNCDQKLLYRLLYFGFNFDMPDIRGDTPILLAAEKCDVQAVRLLSKHGANIWKINQKGRTIMHIAALHGNMKLLEECIWMGIDVQQKDNLGESSILIVAKNFEMKHVLSVLKFINAKSYFVRSTYSVKELKSNKVEDAALLLAVVYADVPTVRTLIERGADFNCTDNKGRNIFHVAAEHTRLELVKLCLELGLNPNQKDQFGESPIEILRRKHQQKDTIECLQEIEAKSKKSNLNVY